MNTEEIIDMARQAGFRVGPSRDGPDDVRGAGVNLEWFAKLVDAKATAREREACAKVCEDASVPHPDEIHTDAQWSALYLATAIRNRGDL